MKHHASHEPDRQLKLAARRAFDVLLSYDRAGKGGMTFAKWQDARLAALHELKEALAAGKSEIQT
jgi:hypothetical protein